MFTLTLFAHALYPILINKKSVGLIYIAHISANHHLDRNQLSALKTLRNQAALAIKLSPNDTSF